MALYFLDTSAVVKRYVQEIGTAWVQALTFPNASHSLVVVRITLPEMISAVTRRERGGSLSPADAATALSDFQHDFTRQYLVVEVSAGLIADAASLARRYGLSAYDAVQLAAAREVRTQASTLELISADNELNAAARAEGLPVEDPNTHP